MKPVAPLITIVETRAFLQRAAALLTDDEREDLKAMLAADPECGVVIRGTGGLRKVRLAVQGRGKSGGARTIYYYRNETMPLFLLSIFAKNEKDDLSQAERHQLADFVERLVDQYRRLS
ncbi:RelE toxin of RelE / RelB toxin-antitoxin system [Caenispirillum bisanense]|uniref:RelE toxin of RelE / RelB toxin-antitoxin system n=1 Tax=Caenispirillum bisanense TaxID=414052 RepID=A0A286GTK4_9PROT|nr:RelE toxin of RelE / RelB toxin-antitoxin system [Caenispirillum bisanense]